MEKRLNVSRTRTTSITQENLVSIGASYSHIKSLERAIGPDTKRIVMYHAMLENMRGFEKAKALGDVYIGFNRIEGFEPQDACMNKIDVLDLAGNPITSLKNSPLCRVLIISSTLVPDLQGTQEGIEIIRCGHSMFLRSLRGCPKSVKIIECSCAPNLVIDKDDLPEGLEEIITDQKINFECNAEIFN